MNSAHSSPSESDLSYPSPPSSPTLHILAPRFRPLARPLRFIDQASVPTPIGFVDNAGAMFATISVEEAEEGEVYSDDSSNSTLTRDSDVEGDGCAQPEDASSDGTDSGASIASFFNDATTSEGTDEQPNTDESEMESGSEDGGDTVDAKAELRRAFDDPTGPFVPDQDADLDEEGDPQTEGVDSVASDVDNGPTSSQRSTITIETNPETDDSDYSDDDLSSELSDVPPELPSPLKSHEPASAIDEDEEDELLDDDEPTDHPAGGKAVVAEPVEHVELQHASQREHGTPNSHILRGAEVAAFLPRTPSPKHVFRRASDVSPHCNPLARLLVPSQRAHDSNAASVPWAMPIGSSSSEQATSGLSPADPTSTLVAGPTTSLHDPAADTGPKSLTSACSASAAPSSRVDEDSTRAGERLSTVPSTSVTSSPGFDVVGQHVAADDPEPASKKRRIDKVICYWIQDGVKVRMYESGDFEGFFPLHGWIRPPIFKPKTPLSPPIGALASGRGGV
ncbi:unnamed protein product [Tilletia laevis]|uniref:Uncharacterized protein n=2 Tax=Tilletia TaxID=13289 RepID=A0A177UIN3_9BASI|nr:hypothetical protein CF336_g6435 [Tilletia laevis]KAE8254004.1 hypothetical protein A4X03_0g5781 [Tilletia caries]KAE8192728.1 hypothetical protein CF335_g5768 [Tilletia laevis]CAD6900762.1 unnamed protein product [Tilletia laevis]CAD6936566.1 unnamed protein product [Tilletia laevis]